MTKRIKQMWDEYDKIVSTHSNECGRSNDDVDRFKKILRTLEVEDKILNSIDVGHYAREDSKSGELNETDKLPTSATYQAIKKITEGKNPNERRAAEKFEQELIQSTDKTNIINR